MAIRYREKSDAYQVYWNNPITHKREVKTFHNKQEAEKENSLILHRLRYEPETFSPSVSTTGLMEKFNLTSGSHQHKSKYSITLRDVYNAYLEVKQFSPVNESGYNGHMKPILKLIGNMSIQKITSQDINAIKDVFSRDTKIAQATVRSRLIILRAVINFAVNLGLRDPIKFPKIPNANYKKFIPPSISEIQAMYKVAPNHIKRVLILGAYFGARVGRSELLQLTWNDVDWNKRVLRIHGSIKNLNAPWREVPIREDFIDLFKTWYESDKVMKIHYLIHFKGKAIKSLRTAWKTVLRRAGITRRIRPYDLRHSFGTELIAHGADIGTVANLMGHSNPNMLLTHYQYVLDSQKQKAISMLPSVSFEDRQK